MADALIGSLPRGLSVDEREKIFANTPLSPALNLLSSLPIVRHSLICPSCHMVDQACYVMLFKALHAVQFVHMLLQDKVGSRTLEGRRLRRHVLRGAVIVFITAGYSGKKFIFEKVCCYVCLN